MYRTLRTSPGPTKARRAELETLLSAYGETCKPGSEERARLEAWPALREQAQQNWTLLMESYRSGQDIAEASLWQLLPYKVTPIAKSRGAFCHPAAAFRDDPRARFAGPGLLDEEDWPVLGRALFDFVLRCDGYPPDLWQACEAFTAAPGGRGFTCGMLSPILNALKPDEFVLINATGRAVLNHFWGCALSSSPSDYASANSAARALLASVSEQLQGEAFRGVRAVDVFEGFSHWLANTRMHPLQDSGVEDPRAETIDMDVFPTSLMGMRPMASEVSPPAAAAQALPELPVVEDAGQETPAESPPTPAVVPAAGSPPESPPKSRPETPVAVEAELIEPPLFDEDEEDAAEGSAGEDPRAVVDTQLARCLSALDRKGQIVLFGPPGSGKGRLARRLAARLVEGGDGLRGHVAFHAQWTYADFIQQQLPDGQRRLGRFTAFCRKAAGRRGCSVLVIEEMQRARVADVLGEALVLLDQRGSEITLAGGGSLVIPPRVRLIATVDSSVDEGLLSDPVLRQRFAFIPIEPLPGIAS
jgi:hypothetical protein